MAYLQIPKSGLVPFPGGSKNLRRKSSFFFYQFNLTRFQRARGFGFSVKRWHGVCCRSQENENETNGEEPPESLFMKELRRRGMTPTLLEDSNRSLYGITEDELKVEEDKSIPKRNGVISANLEKSLSNQRERSMALNSEGLEGLIPRTKLLLTIGGTFFLGFWPLILVTVALFAALYIYFGPSFVHDGSNMPSSPPTYIDPYKLLEDERLSQPAPTIK
ncbi:hypothetical protein H6P81_020169 [Aristolochia fimbriata]|uniref:Tubulin alpha-6 chain n=1 Tax=Aristolochia fimbriata TaxID=158543 RepID=A0AAV7DVL7_ARIFI|nr:hypothetical protein H6P81_020169 [Aristolochia fimbriata]